MTTDELVQNKAEDLRAALERRNLSSEGLDLEAAARMTLEAPSHPAMAAEEKQAPSIWIETQHLVGTRYSIHLDSAAVELLRADFFGFTTLLIQAAKRFPEIEAIIVPLGEYIFTEKATIGTVAELHGGRVRLEGILPSPVVRPLPDTDGGDGPPPWSPVWKDTWSPAWSRFVPVEVGGAPYLFLFRSRDGWTSLNKIKPGGKGYDEVWTETWDKDWSAFTPVRLGGEQCLLSFRGRDGWASLDRIKPGGQGYSNVWTHSWAKDWTHFVAFEVGATSYLLSYKYDDGTAALDKVTSDGTNSVWRDTWSKGWTSLTPFVLDTAPYLLLYRSGTGQAVVDKIPLS